MARFTRDLAAMLAAGWTLPRLLETIAKQADDLRVVTAFSAVKDDLEKPNGKPTKKGEQDPSKPSSTLGR